MALPGLSDDRSPRPPAGLEPGREGDPPPRALGRLSARGWTGSSRCPTRIRPSRRGTLFCDGSTTLTPRSAPGASRCSMACTPGITAVPRQIEEMVRAWKELFPRVVGLKMFAGQSTGNMGIIDPREQALVYQDARRAGLHGRACRALREGRPAAPRRVGPARPVEPRAGAPAGGRGRLGRRPEEARRAAAFAAPSTSATSPRPGPSISCADGTRRTAGTERRLPRHLRPHPTSRAAGCEHDGGDRGHAAEGEPAPAAAAHARPSCFSGSSTAISTGSRRITPRIRARDKLEGFASGFPGFAATRGLSGCWQGAG